MAAAWQQLRHLRHRDLLRSSLLQAYERDQLECKVIQSVAFRPLLGRWAELLLAGGKSGAGAIPRDVPSEIPERAEKLGDPEVRWLVRRLASEDTMRRGPAPFPSVLLQRGPQYPFQPWDYAYLQSRMGSIRGTELTQKVELPKAAAAADEEAPRPRDLWSEGCLDDDDFVDFRRAPRG